jgi:hypothetical protein
MTESADRAGALENEGNAATEGAATIGRAEREGCGEDVSVVEREGEGLNETVEMLLTEEERLAVEEVVARMVEVVEGLGEEEAAAEVLAVIEWLDVAEAVPVVPSDGLSLSDAVTDSEGVTEHEGLGDDDARAPENCFDLAKR